MIDASIPRWRAKIIYNYRFGKPKSVYHLIDEIEQLDELVETGPNMYSIASITIERNPEHAKTFPDLTAFADED